MRTIRCLLWFALSLVPAFAVAQDVTLRNLDGGLELRGALISFDGQYYRLDSQYGPMTVRADGVRCLGPGCPTLDGFIVDARFVGSGLIADRVLPSLIEGFARSRELDVTRRIYSERDVEYRLLRQSDGAVAANFRVISSTTEDGFLALLNGEAEIALALREPSEVEEMAAAAANLEGVDLLRRRARVIALDALVAITAPESPLQGLTTETLADIFTGQVSDWRDLGLPPGRIALHLPQAENGLAQAFMRRIIEPTNRDLAPIIQRHASMQDLAAAVAEDPRAIGIGSYAALGPTRALALSGACGFDLVANPESIKAEDYPLTTPLFAYTPARRMPRLVREFIAYFQTPEAERLVRQAGFVSQSITSHGVAVQGQRFGNALLAAGEEVSLQDLQTMTSDMLSTERLSITLRFADGSSELATQSRAALSRLVADIEAGGFDDRRLTLVGFSDGAGRADVNLRLSQTRAESVQAALQEALSAEALARIELATAGYGEALPMACDDTDWGRAVNRRVEVWLE